MTMAHLTTNNSDDLCQEVNVQLVSINKPQQRCAEFVENFGFRFFKNQIKLSRTDVKF